MPTQPNIFRDAYYRCEWIFDLFAHGFDFLNGRFFPPPKDVVNLRWEAEEEEVRRRGLLGLITRHDGNIPPELQHYIQVPGEEPDTEEQNFHLRLYCALSVIDRAVADLNYLAVLSGLAPKLWQNTLDHVARNRHQLQRSATGIVAFRPRDFETGGKTWCEKTLARGPWKPIPRRDEFLPNYFQNLLRVEAQNDCEVEIRLTNPAQDFEIDPGELRLGIAPLINTLAINKSNAELLPGELRIVKENDAPPTFGIRPAPATTSVASCAELCECAEKALRYLAERNSQIVLFPEMVVPDPVLVRLKSVLFELDRSGKPRPSLTLAGTFSRIVTKHSATTPFNVAVGLNGRGEELWRQRKLQPYDMKRYEQERFGLDNLLNSESCRENIAFVPRRLRFVDSRQTGLRIATLICEDATSDPGLGVARDLRANLILAPVMAGPLTNEGGFTALDSTVQNHDAVFIVANSGGLARKAWNDPKSEPPLAMVGIPLLLPSNGFRPHELLTNPIIVPGTRDVQVFFYQLPGTRVSSSY
jgi:predicted amidohydrolase